MRARIVLTYPVQNGIRRLGDFRRGAQVQHDTVYIGFVGDVGDRSFTATG
jgi:hypothetical protein